MDVTEIRLRNYRTLFEQFKLRDEREHGGAVRGTLRRFGEFIGINGRYLSHVSNGRRTIGNDTARKLELAFNLPHGWVDQDHVGGTQLQSNAEREFIELALRLFRASPIEAQSVLLRFAADRLLGEAVAPRASPTPPTPLKSTGRAPVPVAKGRGKSAAA